MFKKVNSLIVRYFDLAGAPLLAAGVGLLFMLESRYPLRRRKESRVIRLRTNTLVASSAALGLRLVLIPALVYSALYCRRQKLGLLRQLRLPAPLANLIAFLVLDYGNYVWHMLNHKLGFLWRFHQVHHADLDLDVSTALRFHVGEILASVLFRGAWAAGLGASPKSVLIYEILFEGATNFHHSNLRLNENTDKNLSRLIVTPRMHGIHHSIVRNETDSNYCIIFTFWDRLHHTFRQDIPQEQINIGIPYIRDHKTALSLMSMPFKAVPAWELPDGTVPERE